MKKLGSTQSILCGQSADELKNFHYDAIYDDLQRYTDKVSP